ncbi:MAG: CHAT domain-containing protein [Bacteroidales bacterium]|nr:CHAT domain-containing protein [Bacteroidales bacterium]
MKILLSIELMVFLLVTVNCKAYNDDMLRQYQKELLVPEHILLYYAPNNQENSLLYSKLLETLKKGDQEVLNGNLPKSISYYQKSLEYAKHLKQIWLNILLLNRLGNSYYWQARFNSSEEYYTNALELIRSSNGIKDTLAFAESLIYCRILTSRLNTNQFISMESEIEDIFSNADIKDTLRNIKFSLLKAQYGAEISNTEILQNEIQNVEGNLKVKYHTYWHFLLSMEYFRAFYYYKLRDYNLAIKFFEDLEIQINKDNRYEYYRYFVNENLADIHMRVNNIDRAISYLGKNKDQLKIEPHLLHYNYYVLLAYINELIGNIQIAQYNYHKAEKLILSYNIKDYRLAFVFFYLSDFYKNKMNNNAMSFEYANMAEEILIEYPRPILEMFVVYILADYYYDHSDYEMAIFYCNLVLDDLNLLINDDEYFSSQYSVLVQSPWELILGKRALSFFYLSESKDFDLITLQQSYLDYSSLVKLELKFLSYFSFEETEVQILNRVQYNYYNLINVGYTIYEETGNDSIITVIFNLAEESRTPLLRSYLSDNLARKMSGVPEEDQENLKVLKKEIDTLQYTLSQHNVRDYNASENFIAKKMVSKLDEYNYQIELLEERYPAYAKLKKTSQIISVSKVQELLDEDQVIVEYLIAGGYLYTFFIDKEHKEVSYQQIEKDFSYQILEYRRLFTDMNYGDFSESVIKSYLTKSHALYDLLIGPVKDLIKDKRLLIIPDRELNLIPFEALVSDSTLSENSNISFRDLHYLVLDNPVSYLYSRSQLAIGSEKRNRRIRFSGFAPDYGNSYNKSANKDTTYIDLSWLPGASMEIETALKYYKGKAFTGDNASKDNFFKASTKSEIVHLAMHAILDQEEPMNSQLIFKKNGGSFKDQLHAYEVYSRNINVRLMVLSACNTGSGELEFGEGVFGIARAFLLAGIRNIIVTQWSVADRSSASIMNKYYYYLSKGEPVDIALQKSKINFLLKDDPVKAHPYYWAGFVNMGKPVILPRKNNLRLILITIVLVIGFGAIYFRYKRLKY